MCVPTFTKFDENVLKSNLGGILKARGFVRLRGLETQQGLGDIRL